MSKATGKTASKLTDIPTESVAPKARQGRVAKSQLTKDGLTPKQSKFVQGIAQGKPAYKAAMDAYNTNSLSIANGIAVENQQKPTVREAIAKALDYHGVTAIEAAQPVMDALNDSELDMRLKGSDRYFKLLQMTDNEKNSGGNTFNFNLGTTTNKNYMKD